MPIRSTKIITSTARSLVTAIVRRSSAEWSIFFPIKLGRSLKTKWFSEGYQLRTLSNSRMKTKIKWRPSSMTTTIFPTTFKASKDAWNKLSLPWLCATTLRLSITTRRRKKAKKNESKRMEAQKIKNKVWWRRSWSQSRSRGNWEINREEKSRNRNRRVGKRREWKIRAKAVARPRALRNINKNNFKHRARTK